jgi:branched-chain amino acid transport system substrate-binding protein
MIAALSLGVWADLATPASAQETIRIGASASQTGQYALFGQNHLRGYQLCVKHTNEKGGVLGRPIELIAEDDRSEPTTAVRIYDKLLTQDKVNAVLGPYSSPITDAVADLAEKHRMPMLAPAAATPSIFKKGRKFVFMVTSAAGVYLEGLIDMAAKRHLNTVAIVHEDSLFPRSIAQGAMEIAKKRGLSVVRFEAYPPKTTDFSPLLTRVRAGNPEVIAAATYFDDAVAITRRMKEMDVNPKMFGLTTGVDLPRFYEVLGRGAEFVYGATHWEPELMMLVREGVLIPVARRYPGAREFVEAHWKEFPGAELSYHSAAAYAACQLLVEAMRRSGSIDGEKVRDAILKLDLNTVFGAFKVNQDGLQTAHKMLTFQWQDGKKVIVWPDELAPGKPRFPTPPWKERP